MELHGLGVSPASGGRAARAVGNDTTVANGVEPPARQGSDLVSSGAVHGAPVSRPCGRASLTQGALRIPSRAVETAATTAQSPPARTRRPGRVRRPQPDSASPPSSVIPRERRTPPYVGTTPGARPRNLPLATSAPVAAHKARGYNPRRRRPQPFATQPGMCVVADALPQGTPQTVGPPSPRRWTLCSCCREFIRPAGGPHVPRSGSQSASSRS